MKTKILPAALLLAFSFLAYSQSAYGADWNKDLSKMMDGLEEEVGEGLTPGSPPTPTRPQAPPQELPQAPSSHPDKMPGSDQIDNTFKNLPADQDNQLPVEPKETSIAPQQPLKPNHTAQENPTTSRMQKFGFIFFFLIKR